MTAWQVKGWCPGALRPMASGDGLIVRVRPPGGRLSPAQAEAIARAALAHGNGIIDLSARANLQLRGVTEASHGPLIADLRAHGLIDPDIETEQLRNLIVTPFRPASSYIDALTAVLTAALAQMPPLPGKFGFALDCGPRPVLSGASADIRVERAADGQLILRPDGYGLGRVVNDLAQDAVSLAQWFAASGGVTDGRGRMAALIGRGVVPPGCDTAPAQPLPQPLPQPAPGPHAEGVLVALAFGQMRAETLIALAALGHELRPTPWRMLFLAAATQIPAIAELVTDPAEPLLRVTACTGAPGCPQALGQTRTLARSLAALVPAGSVLHVSGCAKGCAHPGPADLTLIASPRGFGLVRGGTASDTPMQTGLSPADLPDLLKAPHAPPL
ncbi:MAG: precorrin-3B synthase [Tabrizicola sp.]|uniref:precorrin-3B synthase n=1 Tax=Tabrizicola sp. TaxID=2005166 RepID=UPI0027329227|nr:precorrin-3B synthase [Tabrizicola sp.]MDP3262643.1 precorrin-3B synthase [Tabrizicola sp.]MDP3647803.1 precorrin-3B synthase [Paracoccaceae bacterium]